MENQGISEVLPPGRRAKKEAIGQPEHPRKGKVGKEKLAVFMVQEQGIKETAAVALRAVGEPDYREVGVHLRTPSFTDSDLTDHRVSFWEGALPQPECPQLLLHEGRKPRGLQLRR